MGLVRHRQTKGPETDRPHLNHRVTPRLHTDVKQLAGGEIFVFSASLAAGHRGLVSKFTTRGMALREASIAAEKCLAAAISCLTVSRKSMVHLGCIRLQPATSSATCSCERESQVQTHTRMMSSPGCCQPFEWISGPIGIDFYPNQLARNKLATEPGSPRSTGERMQKLPPWNGRKNHLCTPNTSQRG